MFTMMPTYELKDMLKKWKTIPNSRYARSMIKAIRIELKLRKQ